MEDKIVCQYKLEQEYNKYSLDIICKTELDEFNKSRGYDLNKYHLKILKYLLIKKRCHLSEMLGYLRGENINALEELINANLVLFDNNQILITKLDFDLNTLNKINKFRLPMPLITRPKEVKKNNEVGYHSLNMPLVLNMGNKDLEDLDLNTDFINLMNQTGLKISDSSNTKYLKDVYNFNFKGFLEEELEYLKDKTIYLIWRYDKRGRVYPNAYYINPQGVDTQKALLELADEEIVEL